MFSEYLNNLQTQIKKQINTRIITWWSTCVWQISIRLFLIIFKKRSKEHILRLCMSLKLDKDVLTKFLKEEKGKGKRTKKICVNE